VWYWHCRGDGGAVDFDNPAALQDFRRHFEAMLDECPWARRDWATSGLRFNDLLEAAPDAAPDAQAA
jgi:hypothetical protein